MNPASVDFIPNELKYTLFPVYDVPDPCPAKAIAAVAHLE